jgi:outer membrane protein assembly factor BamB
VLRRLWWSVSEAGLRILWMTAPPALAVLVFVLVVHPLARLPDPVEFDHTTAPPGREHPVPDSVGGVGWVWDHPDAVSTSFWQVVAVPTGVLVFDRGGVYALDSAEGVERWRLRPESEIHSWGISPDGAVAAVSVIERGPDGPVERLLALDTGTGWIRSDHARSVPEDQTERWRGRLELSGDVELAHDGAGSSVYGHDLATGERIWENSWRQRCTTIDHAFRTETSDVPTAFLHAFATTGDLVLVAEYCDDDRGSRLTALDSTDGRERWSQYLGWPVVSLDTAPDGRTAVAYRYAEEGRSTLTAVAVDMADGSVLAEGLPDGRKWERSPLRADSHHCQGEQVRDEGRAPTTASNGRSVLVTESAHGAREIDLTRLSLGTGEERTASLATVRPFDASVHRLGCIAVIGDGVVGAVSGVLVEEGMAPYGTTPRVFAADWGAGDGGRVIDISGAAEGFVADDVEDLILHTAPGAVVVSGAGPGDKDEEPLRLVGLTP